VAGTSFEQRLGASTDDGVTFRPKFYIGCLGGPLACAGGVIARQCSPGLPMLHATIGVCPEVVDAAAEAGGDGGADGPPGHGACGCTTGEAAGTASALSAFALFSAIALRRLRWV
jgi:hypothetical protein